MLPSLKTIHRWGMDAKSWKPKNIDSIESQVPKTLISVAEIQKMNQRITALSEAFDQCQQCKKAERSYIISNSKPGKTESDHRDLLSIPEIQEPLTVEYLTSCLMDIPNDAIIFEIKTRASNFYHGTKSDDDNTVEIYTNQGGYGFD